VKLVPRELNVLPPIALMAFAATQRVTVFARVVFKVPLALEMVSAAMF
tara:strand:+ start:644 stop:787 length:144 start_codon:yes stop_codon:yes gene_type:complete